MGRCTLGLVLSGFAIWTTTSPAWGHDAPEIVEAKFSSAKAEAAGTLMLPHLERGEKVPCVVIIGGTLSDTRDGRLSRAEAPPRDALKRLAEALVVGGYASLRYDKVGHGASRPREGWRGTYSDESEVAAAAIAWARARPQVSRVIVAGESAGAYVACLAARSGMQADAYVFLGPLCGTSEEMYAYNFGRLVEYVDQSAEHRQWAQQQGLQYQLALGRSYKAMLAAAAEGKSSFTMVDGEFRAQAALPRRQEELQMPPDEMFKHISAPALVLAGQRDLNVPPEHAAKAADILRKAGNKDATSRLIAGADHSFQQTPADEDERFRERHSLASFRRGYEGAFYRELLSWLHLQMPTSAEGTTRLPALAANPRNARAKDAKEIDPLTDHTPRRVQLAPGVEIVDDITDARQTAGVQTLEGRIGPLLLADGCQAHFIDMPAGMYVEEHPHSSESIIYTVRGRWVLCSQGRRHVMQPGSLFRFAADTPTGYETPFPENAFILIFKGDRITREEKEFIDYLQGMAARLVKEQQEGIPYLLKDLPADHPARKFAADLK